LGSAASRSAGALFEPKGILAVAGRTSCFCQSAAWGSGYGALPLAGDRIFEAGCCPGPFDDCAGPRRGDFYSSGGALYFDFWPCRHVVGPG